VARISALKTVLVAVPSLDSETTNVELFINAAIAVVIDDDLIDLPIVDGKNGSKPMDRSSSLLGWDLDVTYTKGFLGIFFRREEVFLFSDIVFGESRMRSEE